MDHTCPVDSEAKASHARRSLDELLGPHSLGRTRASQYKVKVYPTNTSQHPVGSVSTFSLCTGFLRIVKLSLSLLLLVTHGTVKIGLRGVWPSESMALGGELSVGEGCRLLKRTLIPLL